MAERADIIRAAEVLKAGGLVAIPTETVYGLGADARNETAVRRIFRVKGRPETHPLIVHVARSAGLDDWAIGIPPEAHRLAAAFWPGPLTLILRKNPGVPLVVTGGQETIAIRVPNHPDALALLEHFGGGIAAPSANRFGRVSPTTAADVREDLDGDVDFILDGGPCAVGVESTILDLTGPEPRILRPGGVTREVLEAFLGRPIAIGTGVSSGEAVQTRAPGMLDSHYSPRARVRLETSGTAAAAAREELESGHRVAVWPGGGLLTGLPRGATVLDVPAKAAERAQSLYTMLRGADRERFDVIVVTLPEASGLDAAVVDRLSRAAGPKNPADGKS